MKSIYKLLLLITFLTVSYCEDTVRSKELYLDYTSYPKRVFTGQKFDLTLKVTVLKSALDYDKIVLTYHDEENIEIITNEPKFSKEKENIFFTKLTFKTLDGNFKLPNVTVAIISDEKILNFQVIEPPKIRYEKIAINQELFSGIIAKDIEILTTKTKQFNNNTLHTTIHIQGKNSNLEDINLSRYDEQGIKSITSKYPLQDAYFYVMTPSHKKQIQFTYYNTVQKDFTLITIPISLEEDLVSTQTDLNPYNSNILIYKQSAAAFFLILFIILFIIRRSNIYLVFITIFIIILTYLFIPNKKIILSAGTQVYILPTKGSTVYKTLDQRELVEIINQKDQFKKVLFKNNNIGWVKSDD